jgi:hypothetical protein
MDETDTEWHRLEGCTNPYQTLRVEVNASSSAILAAYHHRLGMLQNSGTANEHLMQYYQGAMGVIGDPGIRALYDSASQAGVPDCAKFFTDTESRLPVTAYHSPLMYRQLTSIWQKKQCHVFKVLVNDLGSPAGTLAVVLAELRRHGVTTSVAFIRAGNRGPDNKGNKVPVVIGFANTS